MEDEIIVEDKTYNVFYYIMFFIALLVLIIVLFFLLAYFFPNSIFKKILLKIMGPPTQSEKIAAVKKKIASSSNTLPVSMPTDTTDTTDTTNTTNTTNTTGSQQTITTSSNTTVPLDEAVNKYKIDQNYINIHMMQPPEEVNAVTHKKGWCLIGNEKGYNSCVKVGYNDYCMSGDIYPTKDICLNPSLRL
jgi:hypothetical protein